MKIVIIADAKIPVPPVGYGGTERIVWLLGEGLVKQGLKVDLVAGMGSKSLSGELIIHHTPTLARSSRAFRKILFQFICFLRFRNYDVIINFGRVDYLVVLKFLKKNIINLFPNPISEYEDSFLKTVPDNFIPIGISKNQISNLDTRSKFRIIYHAVDLALYHFNPVPGKYLVFLGRLTHNKGVDIAIRVAKKTGLKLKIGGNISDEPDQIEYFKKEIEPQFSPDIEYLGSVNDQQKNELLGNALALLFPIRWDEPFGIVMVESLSCGTPVIAFRRGSVPEVVGHNVSGFVCDTEDAMINDVKRIGEIDRKACRREAEERFSQPVMTQNYRNIIDELVAR